MARYASGALLAVGAVACWTWYPLRNADWLRAHADRPPSTWATAQGLVTLPLVLLGFALFQAWNSGAGDGLVLMPLGQPPLRFAGLTRVTGLVVSWLGTLCWNDASQRLPTSLAGQPSVFETLSALASAFVLRGPWPPLARAVGVVLCVAGVVSALGARPVKAALHP